MLTLCHVTVWQLQVHLLNAGTVQQPAWQVLLGMLLKYKMQ